MLQYGADRSVAEAHYEGIAAHVDFLARQAGYGDGVPQFGARQRSLLLLAPKANSGVVATLPTSVSLLSYLPTGHMVLDAITRRLAAY